ncbi:hypothetical protein [uncultured Croceicoccus sp.]|nr:hypothetical protein [uncultured Croceicoccus sp.]
MGFSFVSNPECHLAGGARAPQQEMKMVKANHVTPPTVARQRWRRVNPH